MRTQRCCMCPNINNPSNQICPAGGPQNKKETRCDFVLQFIAENRMIVFVPDGNDEAQTILNKCAEKNKWKIFKEAHKKETAL